MDVYTVLRDSFVDAYKGYSSHYFDGSLDQIASMFDIDAIQQIVDKNIRESSNPEITERHQKSVLRQLAQQFATNFSIAQTLQPSNSASAEIAKASLKSKGCPYYPC